MLSCRAVLLCMWAAASTEGSSLVNSGWHCKEVLGGPTGAIAAQNSLCASSQCPAVSAYCKAQANISQAQDWSPSLPLPLTQGCPGTRPLKLSLSGFRAVSLHLAAAAHGRPAPQRPRPGPQLPQQCPEPAELGVLRVHRHDSGGGCAPGLWDAALDGCCVLHAARLEAQLTGLGVAALLLGGGTFLSCLHCLADPAGSRAPGEELCGQPPAEGVCHLL